MNLDTESVLPILISATGVNPGTDRWPDVAHKGPIRSRPSSSPKRRHERRAGASREAAAARIRPITSNENKSSMYRSARETNVTDVGGKGGGSRSMYLDAGADPILISVTGVNPDTDRCFCVAHKGPIRSRPSSSPKCGGMSGEPARRARRQRPGYDP